MAGKRKRKLKSLAETIRDKHCPVHDPQNEANPSELRSWSDLPTELLETIFSTLTLKDNLRTSAVCKRWHTIALSVRVTNRPPWLMYFPPKGNLYDFYNPSTRETYSIELRELFGSRVCYSKDGWLLLYRPRSFRTFFFNPFTREIIKLPRLEMAYQIVAFSCAPKDSSCVVFTVKHISPTIVAISTCFPGATQWVTSNYQNRLPFVSSVWNKLAFSNGRFYCLSLTGWLGVFNPKELTWNVLAVPPPRCPENFLAKNWWKGKFLAENNNEILVIYTCCSENPIVFKLTQSAMEWEEVVSLDDVTLFASFLTSHSRTDLLGTMRNRVFFSKVRFYGKHCVSYSLRDERYYPCKQCHDWGEQGPYENIWIDPPESPVSFIEGRYTMLW